MSPEAVPVDCRPATPTANVRLISSSLEVGGFGLSFFKNKAAVVFGLAEGLLLYDCWEEVGDCGGQVGPTLGLKGVACAARFKSGLEGGEEAAPPPSSLRTPFMGSVDGER